MKTELIVLTGMSGAGKSVALHALEDAGYYCVDNLPPELLKPFIALKRVDAERLAIAIDARSADTLAQLPLLLASLKSDGIAVRMIFLDASDQTLIQRFSETRRRHPLSRRDERPRHDLTQAIRREREMMADMHARSHTIDTSHLRPAQLLDYVKALITAPDAPLTLVFQSFAFKHGLPLDADFVFDVRMLPNPHYDPILQPLTGMDAPVSRFLDGQPLAQRMLEHIATFLDAWLPALVEDHRSYVTVAIGCTGGRHRSVYLVEKLAARFDPQWRALKRHREMDAERAR